MTNPVNSKWRIAAIVLAVVAFGQGLELFRIKSALKNVFYYDVRVILKNKDTGDIIRGGAVHGPGISSRDLFHQTISYGGGMEAREIGGVAYEPREFGFSAEGYERSSVVVTEDTPSEIVVELEPKEQTYEQAGTRQPDTRPESESKDGEKPQPDTEGDSE